jgi:hypothetical protein
MALPSHLQLSVDSACVQAPNVFTPIPNDGVNTVFAVLSKNISSIQVRIKNSSGHLVYFSTDPNSAWDGTDTTGTGPYKVAVQATTVSGIFLSGFSTLHKLAYDGAPCLTFIGTPVCGDQLDPRICGVTYPTYEVFCP